MVPTTDSRLWAHEIPRGSIWALIIAAIFVLIFAFILAAIPRGIEASEQQIARQLGMFQYPHALAAGLTIANALQEFSGAAPEGMKPRLAALILVGFLSTIAIGIPLFLSSLRRRMIDGRASFVRVGSIVGFLLGGFWMLSIFPATVVQRQVRTSLATVQGIQRVKDDMINSIHEIIFLARQHAMRPSAEGGGSGSYHGFVIPSRLETTTRAAFNITVRDSLLEITGRPLINPVSVFTPEPEHPAPDWTVRTTLRPSGQMEWEFTGQFE